MSPRATTSRRPPVGRIIAALERAHPDARLALDYSTPLELLIALILAAQCTDAKVNEVTPALFARFRTARDWADVPQEALEQLVRQTGFYRQKATAIRACCRQLVERFDGQVPRDFENLLSLPGVGRKTANILLGNAYGIPGIGVDTHVARVSQRLGLTRQTDPDKIEADLTSIVPRAKQIRFCHLLQYHGRRVCVARKPNCPVCIVLKLCPYLDKTPPPAKAPGRKRSRWIR